MNALELKHIYKQYGDFAIRDLSLALPQGCVMGLVGENGAGKSTTIRMLLGMTHPDSGEITVLGASQGPGFDRVKEDLGVVLDEPGFPAKLTARQVGKIMRGTYRRWDGQLFERYLRDLSLPADKPFQDYSRGMKMKLSIAVALCHDAKLLLLDEATSGLDPVVRDELLDVFFEFTRQEDHSILLSSHIVSDLEKLCDYIAFLHQGKLMLCEEKDTLLERYGLLHGTREQVETLAPACVRGRKETPYGVEALVDRTMLPAGLETAPISIEELFVYMTKEAV